MSLRFLFILLIVLIVMQHSKQTVTKNTDKAIGSKTKTEVSKAAKTDSVYFVAPVYAPTWESGRGWPVDWNNDGIIDWRDGWCWNNGCNGAWNPSWYWNGAYENWRGNWGSPVYEPVVARRLGSRDNNSITLEHQQNQRHANPGYFIKDHFAYNIQQKDQPEPEEEDSNEKYFQRMDKKGKGILTAQDIHDYFSDFGEDYPVSEIEEAMKLAGITNGKVDLQGFYELARVL